MWADLTVFSVQGLTSLNQAVGQPSGLFSETLGENELLDLFRLLAECSFCAFETEVPVFFLSTMFDGFVAFTNCIANTSHVFNVSTFTWCHKQRKLSAFKAGVPNLQDVLSYNPRWSWCNNNNRTKVHNKCNALETPWNHSPHPSPWKNCLGDCCFKEPTWLDWVYQILYLLINSKPTKLIKYIKIPFHITWSQEGSCLIIFTDSI